MLLKIAYVLAFFSAVVLVRAMIERSWARIKCLMVVLIVVVVIGALGWIADWSGERIPFGIGTFISFFCGVGILLLGRSLLAHGLPTIIFASLETIESDSGGY